MIEKLGPRRGEMLEMKNPGQGMVRLLYRIPARGLFGYRSEFLTDTRGTGIMHHRFLDYGPWAGPLAGRHARDARVDGERRRSSRSRSFNLQERSTLFVAPGDAGLRGDDHRGELASGRHGRESDEGKEADEHADQGERREHSARAAAGVDAGRRAGVYRGRRADRGDAAVDSPAEARAGNVGRKRQSAKRNASASAPPRRRLQAEGQRMRNAPCRSAPRFCFSF